MPDGGFLNGDGRLRREYFLQHGCVLRLIDMAGPDTSMTWAIAIQREDAQSTGGESAKPNALLVSRRLSERYGMKTSLAVQLESGTTEAVILNLVGADLRGAVHTDRQWTMTRLAGATLDDPQLKGLSAFGTGLPRIPPFPMLLPGTSEALSVAWSPCGEFIATGHRNGSVILWDSLTSQCPGTLEGHGDYVRSVVFSPDGCRLASGSDDKTLRVQDSSSGQCLRTLKGHSSAVRSVAFWARGPGSSALLVSSSNDGTIHIWAPDTGDCLGILLAHGDAWVALRPDGRYRAVGDMSRYLWHISGLARYELGELDDACPELKLAPAEPLIPPAYFQ